MDIFDPNYISPLESDEDIKAKKEAAEIESEIRKISANKAYGAQLDLKQSTSAVPSLFAESAYLLDGRPFRLKDRDYLRMIYDTNIEDGLLMCGRQVEKSTTFSTHISNWTILVPFFRSLYFAPLNDQVKVFSEDRLGRLFTYSQQDIIKRTMIGKDSKQNVFNKSFLNGSLIYLRHCYELGDNIRGISANGVFGDEIQDIDIDALPVIKETQAHAYDLGPGVRINWFSGTPKTYSNTIQQLWDRSNQCEWVVKCLKCGCEQILGEANLAKDKYVCRKCGRELSRFNIAKNARWIKINEKSPKWGFRITQMMNPAMRPADTYDKANTYSKSKFYNEVLGRSHENADKPFTKALLNAMCANTYPMYEYAHTEFANTLNFMGIDWGRAEPSKTVVTIGSTNIHGQFQIIFKRSYEKGEELDPEYQVNDIVRLMYAFKIAYCIADYGDGYAQGKKLKAVFGPKFDMCYYSHNQKKKRLYNVDKITWVVNRTASLTDYVEACQKFRVVLPGNDIEYLESFFTDHLNVQAEYRGTKSKSASGNIASLSSEELIYTHPMGSTDDCFHSAHYAFMAREVFGGAGGGIIFANAYGTNI